MKTYDKLNDKILEGYLSLSSLLEDTVSRWDNFVGDFFGWDSYCFSYVGNSYLDSIRPLGEVLESGISKWFNIEFNKRGITFTNKNLEATVA